MPGSQRSGVRMPNAAPASAKIEASSVEPERPEVVQSLTRTHPDAGKVIPTVASGLAEIRAYVIAHHIASIPSDIRPMVRETPPYARATTFASMDSPGPFEKSTEAYFYVTLPDPSWPEEKKEQLLALYSPTSISILTVGGSSLARSRQTDSASTMLGT